MSLKNIIATAHPFGNRIDLRWHNPDPDLFPSVKIFRHENTYPTQQDDGVPVVAGFLFDLESEFQDDFDNATISVELKQKFLDHEILLSARGVIKVEIPGHRWQIVDGDQKFTVVMNGTTLSVHDERLPFAIDRNLHGERVYYYTLFADTGDPPDPDEEIYRTSAMATAPYNFAGQMYDLLPAIYHRYDTVLSRNPPPTMLPEDRQKGQLLRFLDLTGTQLDQLYSFARAALDFHDLSRVDGGLLPLLADWIGWKTDYKGEIAQQRIEIKNAPFVYETIGIIPTLEATVKRISGWESRTKEFVHNVFLSNRPERLNLWARARSADGVWLDLPKEPLSVNFAYEGRPAAVRDADDTLWLFYHTLKNDSWDIWYKTYREDRAVRWSPSQPLTSGAAIDKYPSAVLHKGSLWVFWAAYHEEARAWSVRASTRAADGAWKDADPFNDGIERRQPFAVVDENDHMWLFWLEREGQRWRLKYTRHTGSTWERPVTFPDDAGRDPRVEGDLFVLFHKANRPVRRLWVFWARQEPTGDPDQTRWTIVFRTKRNTDLDDSGWSPTAPFSTLSPSDHDREPAAFVGAGGDFELFWSSNRAGSWSIWRSTLNTRANTWSNPEQLTRGPYSQRDPLPFAIAEGTMLVYHSNESLRYASKVYPATETVDFRYAGSTTFDSHNRDKIALWGAFEDFQAYSYDAGDRGTRTEDDWYARDTIGLYLTPNRANEREIGLMKDRIRRVLEEFMPMTDRAVLITS